MNIIITNVYCYQNKGDAGIVIAMVERLREAFPGCQIKIVSLYPTLDKGKYEDVYIIEAPILPNQRSSKIKRFYSNLLKLLSMKRNLKKRVFNDFEKALDEADLVVSCGGGYMQCRSIRNFWGDFILHYAQLYAAMFLKKKYVIFAQTIGPFEEHIANKMTSILNNASLVLAREEISYNYVLKTFPNAKCKLTGDIAFLLDNKEIYFLTDEERINVGITVRDWNFPNSGNPIEARANYITSIIKFISIKQTENIYNFFLMPQVIGPDKDNDLLISKYIYNQLWNKDSVYLVEKDYLPGEIKYLYSKMDYFIGTRMHSNIFALSNYVPCLAISYDYKTDGIMKMIQKEEYVLSIDSICIEKLLAKFRKLERDHTYVDSLKELIPIIKNKSYLNIHYLQNME